MTRVSGFFFSASQRAASTGKSVSSENARVLSDAVRSAASFRPRLYRSCASMPFSNCSDVPLVLCRPGAPGDHPRPFAGQEELCRLVQRNDALRSGEASLASPPPDLVDLTEKRVETGVEVGVADSDRLGLQDQRPVDPRRPEAPTLQDLESAFAR